jgi:hypothetical protein
MGISYRETVKKGEPLGTSILGISLSFMILFLSCTSGFAAKRKKTIEIPEGSAGMVGYGSLISLQSMEQTLGQKYEGPIHQIHLMGYEREWTCLIPNNDPQANSAGIEKIDASFLRADERVPFMGTVSLNIHPKKKARINCILYLITTEEMLRFDKRERGYRRVDVTDKIEEFRFLGGKVYVYEGLPGHPDRSSPDKGTYIVIKEFVDLVASACDGIGKDFHSEFDKTTRPCVYQVVPLEKIIWEKAK